MMGRPIIDLIDDFLKKIGDVHDGTIPSDR